MLKSSQSRSGAEAVHAGSSAEGAVPPGQRRRSRWRPGEGIGARLSRSGGYSEPTPDVSGYSVEPLWTSHCEHRIRARDEVLVADDGGRTIRRREHVRRHVDLPLTMSGASANRAAPACASIHLVHERRPRGSGENAALRVRLDLLRPVEPHPDAGDEVRRVADEPDVGAVVRRAGLAAGGNRELRAHATRPPCRAARRPSSCSP